MAVDDHSRLAYTAMYPNEKAASSIDFLQRAAAWFALFDIHVRGVLTDNGPCFYRLQFGGACQKLNIHHRRTRPYRPQTNGKAERFIQTALREWAYARRYETSAQRLQHLQPWTHQYNWHRPHAALNLLPPVTRSGLDDNNLLRHHRAQFGPVSARLKSCPDTKPLFRRVFPHAVCQSTADVKHLVVVP